MKQVLVANNGVVISAVEALVISHPSTVFTNDDVFVTPFTDQLTLTGLTTDKVDSIINQISKQDLQVEIIHLENEPRSIISDAAVQELVSEGSTIITIDR